MKLYYIEGQTHCHECGQLFTPDRIPTIDRPITACTCPDGCRGSWCSFIENTEYCVPVEVQAFVDLNGKTTIWTGNDQNRFGDAPGRRFII